MDTYVRVGGADWDRLGVDAERVAHFVGNRAYMKMTGGHCAALLIRPNATDGAREFFCTVYEKRPQVCRDLARGSAECEGELLAKAARVGQHAACSAGALDATGFARIAAESNDERVNAAHSGFHGDSGCLQKLNTSNSSDRPFS